jgi:hypothetical protein
MSPMVWFAHVKKDRAGGVGGKGLNFNHLL